MPALPVTATLLGTYKSKLTAQALSSAAGSVDILTVAHLLGTTPDWAFPITRSASTVASGGTPVLSVVSLNGSQVVLAAPASGGAQNMVCDVIIEFIQSSNR